MTRNDDMTAEQRERRYLTQQKYKESLSSEQREIIRESNRKAATKYLKNLTPEKKEARNEVKKEYNRTYKRKPLTPEQLERMREYNRQRYLEKTQKGK